jgi:hypothetical protein
MKQSNTHVLFLSVSALVLLVATSVAGIVLDDGGRPYVFTSARGESVDLYGGQGIYQYDNVYKAFGFRSFDWVSLVVVSPLLVLGLALYRRGQFKGRLMLASVFTYLAYIYLIGVMGNALNILFLAWTALFSIGLFGLFLTLASMDIASVPEKLAQGFPRRGLAVYVIILGVILFLQYLAQVISAYATSSPPAALDHYTTLELAALELGLMVPLHIASGVSLWKGKAWAYLAAMLLAFTASMTFVALSLSLLLYAASSGKGDMFDTALTLVITCVAAGFSWAAFRHVKD